MSRLQIYVSEELEARLRERANISGVSVSALACVLLDQGLVLYSFPSPASSAGELAEQAGEIAKRVSEAGLARTIVIEVDAGESEPQEGNSNV